MDKPLPVLVTLRGWWMHDSVSPVTRDFGVGRKVWLLFAPGVFSFDFFSGR